MSHATTDAEGGQALPLALVTLAIGVILVTTFVFAVGVYVRLSGEQATALLDYYAADAGIERARAALAANPAAFPSDTTISDSTVNGRRVTVGVRVAGGRISSEAGGALTIRAYVVTSRAGNTSITARLESRERDGRNVSPPRIIAWNPGR